MNHQLLHVSAFLSMTMLAACATRRGPALGLGETIALEYDDSSAAASALAAISRLSLRGWWCDSGPNGNTLECQYERRIAFSKDRFHFSVSRADSTVAVRLASQEHTDLRISSPGEMLHGAALWRWVEDPDARDTEQLDLSGALDELKPKPKHVLRFDMK